MRTKKITQGKYEITKDDGQKYICETGIEGSKEWQISGIDEDGSEVQCDIQGSLRDCKETIKNWR